MPWPRRGRRRRARGRRRATRSRRCRRRPRPAGGVEQRALRRDHGQRPVGAGARRHVGVGEHAQGEVAGRQRDRERAVEVAAVLGGGAGEVELELVAGDGRAQPQLEVALGAPRARRSRCARRPRARRSARGCGAPRSRASRASRRAARRARSARPAPPAARRPARFAASWARRSASRWRGLRIRLGQVAEHLVASARVGGITTPSSASVRESAGMLPGSRAPTSAWWARLAAKPSSSPPWNTGEITVMSGRCVPPR